MVVWQGITEGGTAVPVQITEDGKVVAIGEQGPKGDPGEQGEKGDKGDTGPAGTVEWPPHPFEGAFLTWIGGEAVWYSANPPIPIVPGVTAPIARVTDNSILEFDYPVDLEVFVPGALMESCDQQGNWLKGPADVDFSQIWTPYLTASGGFSTPAENLFIENAAQGVVPNNITAKITMDISQLNQSSGSVNLSGITTGKGKINLKVTGDNGTFERTVNINGAGPFGISDRDAINPRKWEFTNIDMPSFYLTSTAVNGIRPLNGPLCSGTISAAGNNYILLSRVSGTWEAGMYGKTQASRIAPWRMEQIRRAVKVS